MAFARTIVAVTTAWFVGMMVFVCRKRAPIVEAVILRRVLVQEVAKQINNVWATATALQQDPPPSRRIIRVKLKMQSR